MATGLHDSIRESFVVLFWSLYSFFYSDKHILRDFRLLKGSLNISFFKGWVYSKFQGFTVSASKAGIVLQTARSFCSLLF